MNPQRLLAFANTNNNVNEFSICHSWNRNALSFPVLIAISGIETDSTHQKSGKYPKVIGHFPMTRLGSNRFFSTGLKSSSSCIRMMKGMVKAIGKTAPFPTTDIANSM